VTAAVALPQHWFSDSHSKSNHLLGDAVPTQIIYGHIPDFLGGQVTGPGVKVIETLGAGEHVFIVQLRVKLLGPQSLSLCECKEL